MRRTFGVFGVLLFATLLMSGICIAQSNPIVSPTPISPIQNCKARASVSTLLCPGPGRGAAFQSQSGLDEYLLETAPLVSKTIH